MARYELTPAELQARIAAEKRGLPFLEYRDAEGRQQLLELGRPGAALTLGRDTAAFLSVPWDHEASRIHAVLEPIGPEWVLVDDGLSKNGTYLNDRRLVGRRRLCDRDRIRLGRTEVTFRSPASGPIETTVRGQAELVPRELSASERRILGVLCRPFLDGGGPVATPSNREIAQQVHLSEDAVRTNLRHLFERFGIKELPQNRKRAKLAEIAIEAGLIARDEP
jgi:FHA domain